MCGHSGYPQHFACGGQRETPPPRRDMQSASNAKVLRGGLRSADGGLVEVSWLAWRRPGEATRWELRRVLPSLGYTWSSANTKVKDRVSSQLPTWGAWWLQCRLVGPTFGRSARSSDARGESQQEGVVGEQEFWFSSAALLCC